MTYTTVSDSGETKDVMTAYTFSGKKGLALFVRVKSGFADHL